MSKYAKSPSADGKYKAAHYLILRDNPFGEKIDTPHVLCTPEVFNSVTDDLMDCDVFLGFNLSFSIEGYLTIIKMRVIEVAKV